MDFITFAPVAALFTFIFLRGLWATAQDIQEALENWQQRRHANKVWYDQLVRQHGADWVRENIK